MIKKNNLMVIGSENIRLTHYKGLAKPIISGNSMSNIVLEKIHQVQGNLVRNCNMNKNYVDKDDHG